MTLCEALAREGIPSAGFDSRMVKAGSIPAPRAKFLTVSLQINNLQFEIPGKEPFYPCPARTPPAG
jgi:hypothetical protein